MNILSIQSHVAYGHVGNASAVFPMQRLGVEVWPIHTVQFSNHTGYGAWTGRVFDAPMIEELVEGIAARGVLGLCDGVLSGYMGSADIGNAILSTVAKVRAENPGALYCCDPVIGDVGPRRVRAPRHPGVFPRSGRADRRYRHPEPVRTRLSVRRTSETLAAAKDAAAVVQRLGPRVVLVTSLHTRETPPDAIDLLAGEGGRFWRVRTPKLPLSVNGAGDAIAALFFVHYARTRSAAGALGEAAASIYGLLKRTAEAGSREILMVAAQDEFVSPSTRFAVEVV